MQASNGGRNVGSVDSFVDEDQIKDFKGRG